MLIMLICSFLLSASLPYSDDYINMINDGIYTETEVSGNDVLGSETDVYGSDTDVNDSKGLAAEYLSNMNEYIDTSIAANNEAVVSAIYSSYTGYGGTIGNTYLDFFRGYLTRLKPFEHYVLFRESQYVYTLAMGNLNYNGSFVGDVTLYRYNNYDYGSVSVTTDSNFVLNPNGMVYTDLHDSSYPSLVSYDVFTLRQILYVIIGGIIGWVINQFFRKR